MDDYRVGPDNDIVIGQGKGKANSFIFRVIPRMGFRFKKHAVFTYINDEAKFRFVGLTGGIVYFHGYMRQTHPGILPPFIAQGHKKTRNFLFLG
jgi:hypothetical protein